MRHCAISWKVAGSIPDDRLSGRSMALGSTQSLTEVSTRSICWGVMCTVSTVLITAVSDIANCQTACSTEINQVTAGSWK